MLDNRFEITDHLGDGAFGAVRLATDSVNGHEYACKIIQVDGLIQDCMLANLKKEIAIMRYLNHPYVVRLHDCFYKTKVHTLYLIVDLCSGGDVFDLLSQGRIPENVARKYFQQLICGVEYCHSRGVCHRDIKPENLLLDSHGRLMLSDFGLSTLNAGRETSTQCGTLNYVAPEVITQPGYDPVPSDVWACGVTLFVLLTSRLPFVNDHDNHPELYKQIVHAAYMWPAEIEINKTAKHLVAKILEPDVKQRYTIEEIQAHPWFLQDVEEVTNDVKSRMGDSHARQASTTQDDTLSKLPATVEAQLPAGINAFELLSRIESGSLTGIVAKNTLRHNVKSSPEGKHANKGAPPMNRHFMADNPENMATTKLAVKQEMESQHFVYKGEDEQHQWYHQAHQAPGSNGAVSCSIMIEFLHMTPRLKLVTFKPWKPGPNVQDDDFSKLCERITHNISFLNRRPSQSSTASSAHRRTPAEGGPTRRRGSIVEGGRRTPPPLDAT